MIDDTTLNDLRHIIANPDIYDVDEWLPGLVARLDLAEDALEELNDLRSNVTATQSASWSNTCYPLVAILNRAGYQDHGADVTQEQMADHMLCYGGAGFTPKHLSPDCRRSGLWLDRRNTMRNQRRQLRDHA
jgi:hypothetical protein